VSPEQQQGLIAAIAGSLKKVPRKIQEQMVEHFRRADRAYGNGVAAGLGLM
jgi:catalase